MCSLFGFLIQQFFICLFYCKKKTAFVCKFQHTPLWNFIFSQCSTLLVGMRVWRHVPNSIKNKNMKSFNSYPLKKMVFLASKTLLSTFGPGDKNFLINFDRYNLANSKEWVCKIWWACRHRSQLHDLTNRSTKRVLNFWHFTLLSIEVVLRLFWWKTSLKL
jgi:hypothetical protein